MKTQIHIVSHRADAGWLAYNLKSIQKFATGFSGVTLVVPDGQTHEFTALARVFDCQLRTHTLPGHLGAQVQKCLADEHCPNADFILHTDSDCIFTEPVTPGDYFRDGKPVMLIERFGRLPGNPWQLPVEYALGWPCEYETMRRHPQVNPRGVYAAMRRRVEVRHGKKFAEFVMCQKPDFPWGFTEHCTIGAFALHDPNWHAQYHWIDVEKDSRPPDKLTQFWSHGPLDQEQGTPFGFHLTPVQVYEQLGL